MPKMFVHAPTGTFSEQARAEVAAALTDLGIRCERLAHTDNIKKGVWVFFSEHSPDSVFSGGEAASKPLIALVTYAIQGGLDDTNRTTFIGDATAILGQHAKTDQTPPLIYVVIQQTPEADWGMYGKQVDLAAMRKV